MNCRYLPVENNFLERTTKIRSSIKLPIASVALSVLPTLLDSMLQFSPMSRMRNLWCAGILALQQQQLAGRAFGDVRSQRISPVQAQRNIGQFGLVLCFPYRSGKIEPVPGICFSLGNGGGWIALGLVVMDRF